LTKNLNRLEKMPENFRVFFTHTVYDIPLKFRSNYVRVLYGLSYII